MVNFTPSATPVVNGNGAHSTESLDAIEYSNGTNSHSIEIELLAVMKHRRGIIAPVCKQSKPLSRPDLSDPINGCIFGAFACASKDLGIAAPADVESLLEDWARENSDNAPLAAQALERWASLPEPQVSTEAAKAHALKLAKQIKTNALTQSSTRSSAPQNSGSVGSVGSNNQESPNFDISPSSIVSNLETVPLMPTALIPEPFRDWLCDISERMSCPIEYPTVAALIALSSLVGRRLGIRPKRHDDWTVIPNLWGGIIGPPGVQKTPATDEAMKPLKRLAANAIEAHKANQDEYEAGQEVAKVMTKVASDNLMKAAKTGKHSKADLHVMARQNGPADDEEPPQMKRYIVNEASVEALGVVLKGNPNGVLMYRDELTAFFKTLEKQGHESDRQFYLESWNGTTENFIYDRIGRGTVVLPSVCVSIFGTIQPGPIARYLRSSANGEDADGLMPRFQLLVYPDLPEWKHVDRWPDAEAKNRAFSIFEKIDSFDAQSIGGALEEGEKMPFVRFDAEAQEFFNEWLTQLETTKLRTGTESPVIEAWLSKYRSLMPSLALLFHLVEFVDGRTQSNTVTLSAAQIAAAWCDLLESHVRRIYQAAFDGDVEPALRLCEKVMQSLPNPFKPRDVVRKGWAGLTTTDDVERAINLMEEKGWIKTVETIPGVAGGRPQINVWINPEILKQRDGGGK